MKQEEAAELARDIEGMRGFLRMSWAEGFWLVRVLGSLVLLGWRLRLWAEGWRVQR